ncbi:LysR family transcriptional regulator [Alginatibacterium sediminis]|uniref:LysR family transcriptional regulator n=1 Tax=Alginatibacterium sediminis TaxID=2164068 RepID=A0A420EDS6_9ALTE|nr:LysR substrate-binding domain-containing protein [Alginatibacterium sediminis]RKF18823.1 LysR family transcriptional regulator [Alginatibacterium sediminis]
MLKLNHLAMLEAMSLSRSLAETAQRLHISPSALSHQLKDLESLLDAPVYKRKTKPLLLSDKGEVIAKLAHQVLPSIRETQSLLRTTVSPTSLRIGARCHYCFDWLFACLSPLQKRYPELEIQLPQANDFEPLPKLVSQDLDIVLSSEMVSMQGLQCDALFDFEMRVLLSSHHPLASFETLNLEQLKDYAIFCFPVDWADIDLFVQMQAHGIQAKQWIKTNSTQSILQRVAASEGIACLPQWNITRFQDLGLVTSRAIDLRGGSEELKSGLWKTLYAVHRQAANTGSIVEQVKQLLSNAEPYFER